MDALNDRIAYFEKLKEEQLVACSIRARADGAIHYFYPLQQLDGKTGQYQKEMTQLKSYIRIALKENKRFHNLTFSNQLGYRIFLVSPWFYQKLRK